MSENFISENLKDIVDPSTGEIVPLERPSAPLDVKPDYTKASMLKLSKEEAQNLVAAFQSEELDVKPTGEVYVAQVHYRRRLNQVLGPGQWSLVPASEPKTLGNTMCQSWALYIRGQFVAQSMGEAEFSPRNKNMSMATALEGAKSNSLTRCCKDLGMASECWDKKYTESFLQEYCCQVWIDGKDRPYWRRKDTGPLYKETGLVNSPRPSAPQSEPVPSKPAAQAPAQTKGNGPSPNQIKRFWAILHSKGMSENVVRAEMEARYGVQKVEDLDWRKYKEFTEWMDQQ